MKSSSISVAILLAASSFAHASPADRTPSGFPRSQHYVGIAAPDGPLGPVLDALKSRATEKDSSAASAIYAGLSKCRMLRRYGPEEIASEYCHDIPETDIADAGAWLSLAAETGDQAAMYVYSIAGEQELRQSVVTSHSTLAKSDYQTRAASYLTQLADDCHIEAIDTMYRQKRMGGGVFAQDTAGAYLLQRELVELLPGLVPLNEITELAGQMSATEVAEADAHARSFISRRCR